MERYSLKGWACMAIALCVAVVTGVPAQAASPISGSPELQALVDEGLNQNKELQSMAAKVESLKEVIPFAGSLDDPRLGIGAINLPTDTFSFNQEPMTQKQLFLAQKIPWFGKLSLREQRQTLIASKEEAILKAKSLELARKIATTYYDLGFISTSLEVNRRLSDMVNQLIRVAETRYATGRGLQQDVLQAQVELSRLLDEKITLEKKRRVTEDRMNELLSRDRFIRVHPPGDPPFPNLKLEPGGLQTRSLNTNPWVAVRQVDLDLASVEIELAKKDYWPDMDFMVAYGQRERDLTGRDLPDFFSASVVVNIPLWQKTKQDKNLGSKEKNHRAARKSYEELMATLPHRVDALVGDITDTQKNYQLLTDALLLQAEQWARASMAAYVVDKVEFNTVINAQIRLLQIELMARKYLFDLYQRRAELEEIVGGPLGVEPVPSQ
jgi:cobalt-zinc-cadmium efflux system outer membrane protein